MRLWRRTLLLNLRADACLPQAGTCHPAGGHPKGETIDPHFTPLQNQ